MNSVDEVLGGNSIIIKSSRNICNGRVILDRKNPARPLASHIRPTDSVEWIQRSPYLFQVTQDPCIGKPSDNRRDQGECLGCFRFNSVRLGLLPCYLGDPLRSVGHRQYQSGRTAHGSGYAGIHINEGQSIPGFQRCHLEDEFLKYAEGLGSGGSWYPLVLEEEESRAQKAAAREDKKELMRCVYMNNEEYVCLI